MEAKAPKFFETSQHERVVLASASPRRIDLLRSLVSSFEVLAADIDEDSLTVKDPHETAVLLAQAKARKVAVLRPMACVIGADTVVAIGGAQLAKPLDRSDAVRMLSTLSGKTHAVITGVCLIHGGLETTFFDETWVKFRPLGPREIRSYVATGEPMDKAGAYAIQGGAKDFVEAVEGSVSNVVGLPLEKLSALLR